MKVQYETITMKYSKKREKEVYIWTPKEFNKKNSKEYGVIYMSDGQNLFDKDSTPYGSWGVAETLTNLEKKYIVVGINNGDGHREEDLSPDIGSLNPALEEYKHFFNIKNGEYFKKFLIKKVMPYIKRKYKINTDPKKTVICGSSLGGLASFYIAMDNLEKFGVSGCFSPAFIFLTDKDWTKYLKEKNFSKAKNMPLIYICNGDADDLEKQLLQGAKEMPNKLIEQGYSRDKIYFYYDDEEPHNEKYWNDRFKEFASIL